jgi:predicted ester cyclase
MPSDSMQTTSGSRASGLARKFEERQSAHDIPGIMALFSDSAEVMVSGMPGKVGKSQFEQFNRGFDQGFPDARMKIVSLIESGDTAAGEIEYSGTNTGPMSSPTGGQMPPTGKKIMIPGAFILKVREGKITSFHAYFDQAGMAQQLGMTPQSQR